ncbi:MAG: ribokinase [Candidatus Acidiferrum sp.]
MSRRPRIAVVGSANVDLTVQIEEFPRPGETVFGKSFDMGFGGKGANQAIAARLCGAEVMMVAKVGDDVFGEALLKNFATMGIETEFVGVVKKVSSGVAPIFIDPGGQNRIVVVKGANDCVRPADVDAAAEALSGVDTIIVQFEIPLETVEYVIQFAAGKNIRCIVNPAPARQVNLDDLLGADYLIPNETEAETLSGRAVRAIEDAHECAAAFVSKGFRHTILTLGERGSLVASKDGVEHIPPFQVVAKDTSGAGDAFIGSFATFLAEGFSGKDALTRANLYAALSTTKIGTQKSFPSRAEFDAEWGQRSKK